MKFNGITTKFDDFINEGFLRRKTPTEKLSNLMIKLERSYNNLVEEAGSVLALSRGVTLGYHNFGDFTDTAFKIIDIIKDQFDVEKYKDDLLKLKEKTDTISNVKGVSEYSTEQLKFVKRNLYKLLLSF